MIIHYFISVTILGIKDITEFFLNQKVLPVSNKIHEQVITLPNPLKELEVHNEKTLSAPASQIFQYCFPKHKHSFSIVATFQALRKPMGVYLVSVHNSKGVLVWGIKLFGGNVILEYSEGQRFIAFGVDMPLGKWHRAAFSLKSKQVTLYWNCEKSETKSLPTKLSLPLCASGILRLGQLGKGYQRHKMEVCAFVYCFRIIKRRWREKWMREERKREGDGNGREMVDGRGVKGWKEEGGGEGRGCY